MQDPSQLAHHDDVLSDASFAHIFFLVFEGEEARGEMLSEYRLPGDTAQVLNTRTATAHLSEGEGCWCKAWRCGSRELPTPTAEFATSSRRCSYKQGGILPHLSFSEDSATDGGGVLENGQPADDASSTSSSESCFGSSSESE